LLFQQHPFRNEDVLRNHSWMVAISYGSLISFWADEKAILRPDSESLVDPF
jgi:hypothetical protein